MKFHEFVIARRLKFNIDKRELAKQIKIPEMDLEHIEKGVQMPKDPQILHNLADALYLEREWFRNFADIKSSLFTSMLRERGVVNG